MRSRYDAMSQSLVLDAKDSSCYPDPLSSNVVTDLTLTSAAQRFEISEKHCQKFFQLTGALYNSREYAQYDDIILGWNDIAHVSLIEDGDVLFFPSENDILNYLSRNVYRRAE